ncbi:5-AMP-activated protein kinase subunit [Blastocystis sp. subtype 4]|uniref:5-AMP-activated protein kinase subunit n=1 Tax=Blastocystis sp. subtype 4 TaxID=944170 RepID=UPI0007115379|nr:5-AMP-activated protein kinase subunit [Blastocystis sp. subtype 4]KNB45888.1 5-AMP-activated protein kinase subunit [Blastocystis sp. subtype 4]|eukprot:XP_014529331.1 5-AMP-activated protein kinase subunit [Blastocystis sp. subtype 4]
MDPEDDNGIYNIGIGGNLGVPSSYANGAFYADEQDTFVAGTSPPSSPLADGDDNGLGISRLDFSPIMEDVKTDSQLLDELNTGRKNIYDILTQHDAYAVLPPSQKLLVFNTNNPLDLVFQSLRRQEAVEGVIWNANTESYEGVITSSDLLFCLNKQYSLYKEAQQQSLDPNNPTPFPRVLDYTIKQYRDTIYPNSRQLSFGIPNNSLFQILKLMFDCRVHRIPIIDRINEGNLIGVVNYLDILHHLVALYPDRLFNYNYSIRELGIGNYDHLWSVREDCALHEVLQIMETQAIASVPVIDTDQNLIGIFQRTDLIKLDFKDMTLFNYPINTFISSFQPFSSQLIINTNESLSHLFFTFSQRNTTSLVCVDDDNKPCGLVSIVDLFYFFLKGDFSAAAPHVSAPVSVRERPSMSQSYITPLFSPGISASGSMNDMSVGDFCMNLPETIVQPRISNVNREEMDADTYDEDFERMKGNVRRENEFRERNDIGGGMGERFVTKKRIIE